MAKRTAKERRAALAAWLDKIERQVKARLRKLKLPDEIDALRGHLSNPPGVKKVDPQKHLGAITDLRMAAEVVARAIANSPPYQQAYDLFCCLTHLRDCRALLKQREPERIVFYAYELGGRAQSAGLRIVSMTGQQVHQGGREGGPARWGGKKAIEKRHQEWQSRLDELHQRLPGLSWRALANTVAAGLKKLGRTVTGRAIRNACKNPHKQTGK